MKKFINILIIFILGISLYSCQETGLEENYNAIVHDAGVKPLTIGNQWNYEIIYYDSTGSVFHTENMLYEITGSQMISGEEWFIEEHKNENINTSLNITNRNDGLWKWGGTRDFHPNGPYRFVSYPVRLTEEFTVSKLSNGEGDTLKIIRKVTGIARKVNTPAGSFRCIEYTDRKVDFDGTVIDPFTKIYYSPRIGFVKSLRFYKLKSGREILTQRQILTDYSIE